MSDKYGMVTKYRELIQENCTRPGQDVVARYLQGLIYGWTVLGPTRGMHATTRPGQSRRAVSNQPSTACVCWAPDTYILRRSSAHHPRPRSVHPVSCRGVCIVCQLNSCCSRILPPRKHRLTGSSSSVYAPAWRRRSVGRRSASST